MQILDELLRGEAYLLAELVNVVSAHVHQVVAPHWYAVTAYLSNQPNIVRKILTVEVEERLEILKLSGILRVFKKLKGVFLYYRREKSADAIKIGSQGFLGSPERIPF